MTRFLEHAARCPGNSHARIAFWDLGAFCCHVFLAWCYGLRIQGRENIPIKGPVVFIGNHQSLLDPMAHGVAVTDRAPRPLAKESLFANPLFGAALRGFGLIPVREGGSNRDSLRIALEELAGGRTVMLYPEGARSVDGEMKQFRRGIEFLLRKSRATVVPMGIDGAFDAWPRSRRLPKWKGRVWVAIGRPISPERIESLFVDPVVGLAEIHSQVEALMLRCREQLRARREFESTHLRESEDSAWLS